MIKGVSSMATREVLAELVALHRRQSGAEVALESIGGVEAARRIEAGEALDFAVLADAAMATLESSGRIVRGTRVPVATSGVAVAVRAGTKPPDLGNEDAVRESILGAPSIGYSSGPSGTHLVRLFERWGIAEAIRPRIVQPPPGVPVGTLVASGEVALGFQQLSELIHLPGIHVVGPLPAEIQATTTFSGGICGTSVERESARAWLAFITAPEADAVKRRHGMEPPA